MEKNLELVVIRNFKQFNDYKKVIEERIKIETKILQEYDNNQRSYIEGYCELCEKKTRFFIHPRIIINKIRDFRGNLFCEHCGIMSRRRFLLSFLKKKIEHYSYPNVYIYEQLTPIFDYAKKNFDNLNLIGSEYLGYDITPGSLINNIRHEDATNLSFETEFFDILYSGDVFEHVPDIHKTLDEAFRVLKNGGIMLVTIPFWLDKVRTEQRTILQNGKIINRLPEQYHGNPIPGKRSLVFYNYGWDFIDFIKNAGFQDAYMLGHYSLELGYIGKGFQFIFVGKK